jgi:hypothetical protein
VTRTETEGRYARWLGHRHGREAGILRCTFGREDLPRFQLPKLAVHLDNVANLRFLVAAVVAHPFTLLAAPGPRIRTRVYFGIALSQPVPSSFSKWSSARRRAGRSGRHRT